jgi:hypothetical protein
MEPTVPLPVPPKDQENVAFYFTQVNVTADAGTMYSKQCWIRSATATHNLTVDSQGFVTNRTRVTSLEINNDALAGGQYRLNKLDSTSIAASIEGFNAFLRSRTYFWKREDDLNDAKRGSLGSSNTIQDSHLENYTTIDPTSYVVNMLNDVYFRAGAIAGFPATDFQPIDPDLPFDQRQLLPRETTGTRTDPKWHCLSHQDEMVHHRHKHPGLRNETACGHFPRNRMGTNRLGLRYLHRCRAKGSVSDVPKKFAAQESSRPSGWRRRQLDLVWAT